jgi:hypothetical protein
VLVFDLYIADAAECARVHQQLTTAMRAALLPTGREGLELAAQELSPGCSAPPGSRRFDSAAYANGYALAQQRFGVGRVRPLLLYFNNLALPMSESLRFDLQNLRRGNGSPLVWALTLQPASRTDLPFDLSRAWTHSADPALTAPLETAAQAQLPLEHLRPLPEGYAVFTAQELPTVREFKGCSAVTQVTGMNFNFGPKAVVVNPGSPPRVTLNLTAAAPAVRGSVTPVTVRYEVEACRAHCERTYEPPEGDPVLWNVTPGCQLKVES